MQIRILLIITALACSFRVSAQKITVISSSDRAPIEHVAVFNSTKARAAITDTLGVIDLSIFADADSIVFQHPSYLTRILIKSEIAGQTRVSMDRKRILIDEYVISASKSRESTLIIPYMVDVLKDEALMESTGLTSAEILESTGNIAVQKSQGGGGSPILR